MKFKFTVSQIARMAGVSEGTVRANADRGLLPHERNAAGDRQFPEEAAKVQKALTASRRPRAAVQDPDAA
jgi:DNA-binding transcriptional MerR regulator